MDKSSKRELFDHLSSLDTEQRNPATREIDLASPEEIVRLINSEDKKVADCVEKRLDRIAQAVEVVRNAFRAGGRLIYAGAGASGRLGILDAAECPPTFGTNPEQVIGLIAGGKDAVFVAQEGSEDHMKNGVQALKEINPESRDVVCGLAASGRTPYVLGALKYAKELGCITILVCCVSEDQLRLPVDVDILIDIPVGPEVIMGSTRMKSASAQKMVTNMISTGAMIRLGKVYENVMVDLMLTNEKLKERAKRIIMMFTELDYETAETYLDEAGGHVKTALLMALTNLDKNSAVNLLKEHDGFIREAYLSHASNK